MIVVFNDNNMSSTAGDGDDDHEQTQKYLGCLDKVSGPLHRASFWATQFSSWTQLGRRIHHYHYRRIQVIPNF